MHKEKVLRLEKMQPRGFGVAALRLRWGLNGGWKMGVRQEGILVQGGEGD